MKMAFFDCFSLLLAAAFLFLHCRPQHIRDAARLRRAFVFYLWSLVLFYPVSAIFMIGVYIGIVTNPIGMILSILCFRHLCLALSAPVPAALPAAAP